MFPIPAEPNFDGLWILVVGPAVLGVLSLIGGVVLLGTRDKENPSALRTIFAVLLLIVALGIGGCYGVFMLG